MVFRVTSRDRGLSELFIGLSAEIREEVIRW
jgi:hypothetical protein